MLQHDQAGRTGRPLAHGQQRAHAFLGQGGFVQHRASEAQFPAQFHGALGQAFGIEQIARHVGQIPGQSHGLGRALAPAGRRVLAVGHGLSVKAQGQPLRISGFVFLRLFQGRKTVEGQLSGIDAFLHQAFPPAGQAGQSRFGQQDGIQPQAAAALHGGGDSRAQSGGIHFFARSQTHGQDARHGKLRMTMQQDQLAVLALEVAHGRSYGQPGRGLVQFRALA